MKAQRCFRLAAVLAVLVTAVLSTAEADVAALSVVGTAAEIPREDATIPDSGHTLPMLVIQTDDGALPGDEASAASLEIVDVDQVGDPVYVHASAQIRVRGNTSRRFPKKSFKLRIVDAQGDKEDLSIAGLRTDDDWILNALYADTSKIREALAYRLWEAMNRCRQAASSRLRFVEVTLNGRYWGLYGIQERIDRKQVGADRTSGILYKVDANDSLSGEDEADGDGLRRGGMELVFAGKQVEQPWAPAEDYMALLEGKDGPSGSRFSPENTVEFCLWSALVQAGDNHYKNQYLNCVYEAPGYTLYRIPWDLDHTFGDRWSGDSSQTNYVEYGISDLALDDVAQVMLNGENPAFRQALCARWRQLRADGLSDEGLISFARELFEALRPAIERDTRRWPECGMGEGSAANIRDIEDYLRVAFRRLDGWIDALEQGR